jgi:hypothetical protein
MDMYPGLAKCDCCNGELVEVFDVDTSLPKYRAPIYEAASAGLVLNAVRRCLKCGDVSLSFVPLSDKLLANLLARLN